MKYFPKLHLKFPFNLTKIETFFYFCILVKFSYDMIEIKRISFNAFQENTILLWDENKTCIIIDPGYYSEEEKLYFHKLIQSLSLVPTAILLTHAHFDHIHGLGDCVNTYKIPVYMHPNEKLTIQNNVKLCTNMGITLPNTDIKTIDITDEEVLKFGTMTFEVIFTPGHSPGGVAYLVRNEKLIISGDSLFAGSIGRTDLAGGDYDVLMSSIFNKLLPLDGDIVVIPGHGPETSIAVERATNPFLMPFNEPFE